MDPYFDPADPAVSLSWQPVSSNPEVSNQNELNDLLRDMNLSKKS